MLSLSKPEHREALRACCNMLMSGALLSDTDLRGMPNTYRDGFAALSSPAESAAIVRALLEGCGWRVATFGDDLRGDHCIILGLLLSWISWEVRSSYANVFEAEAFGYVRDEQRTPLILRLLAATTREEALAALREANQ